MHSSCIKYKYTLYKFTIFSYCNKKIVIFIKTWFIQFSTTYIKKINEQLILYIVSNMYILIQWNKDSVNIHLKKCVQTLLISHSLRCQVV